MKPIETALALATIAVLLAVLGFHKLALVPALPAVLLAAFIVRVALRLRRQRRACVACGAISKAVATVQTVHEGLMPAENVVRAVQLARAEISHAGAAEARAVLDSLEAEARAHPDGLPGPVVAAARMRFDELMRANVQ